MKNYFVLFILSICYYAASQDSSTVLISEVNLNQPKLTNETPNNFKENETVKSKKDSTAELKKLQAIEQLIKNLEQQLKDSLTKTLKNLPSMVFQEQLDAIKSLKSQNDALIQEKLKLETEMTSLIIYKNSAEANLNNQKNGADAKLTAQKNEYENEITKLNREKAKAESDKNTLLAYKSSEWEAYAKIYLKNEKFISTDLFNKLKVQISSNAMLISDLETFKIQSKRLAAAEDFLYVGKGDLKTVQTDFKNIIDASKYPEQANSQKELQAMFDLFLVLTKEFNAMLGPIKDVSESIRKSEIDNWRYYRIAVNFPYLKAKMQENYSKHKPIEL